VNKFFDYLAWIVLLVSGSLLYYVAYKMLLPLVGMKLAAGIPCLVILATWIISWALIHVIGLD
jgi:hypothetical protein